MSGRAAFVVSVVFFLVGLAGSNAWAQGAPQLQFQADADTVGVGDVLHLELTAQSADSMPSDPQPGATPGFVVRGQSSSPSQTRISINGNRMDRYSLTVDWVLRAQKVGVFSLGPPTIAVGGTRFAGRALTVRVVPAGQAPQQSQQQGPGQVPAPFGFSPFDPWRGMFPGLDRGLGEPPPPPSITTDPKLALDAPRGPLYFLHAVVDPPVAVVGQQVTYSVYEYIDEGAGVSIEVDGADVHDPTAADFVKHPLLRDDQDAVLAGFASVGGHTWKVNLVRRWALFPIHAGDLVIGPMSIALARPRNMAGSKRTTETLHVRVADPPLAGRPPGYALGDVGHFSLSAQVSPRDVDQGGAVGVHVELSGTGNIPASIVPPARPGVEWLAPETHEQLGAMGHETFGGKRTFDYVVRIQTAGNVDLGDLNVPFWDSEQRRYDVARASLGVIHAKPSSSAAPAESAEQILANLPPPRDSLEGTDPTRPHADDRPLFWILGIGAWPLAFGVAVAGRAGGRRIARVWRDKKASPRTELRDRMTAATAACRGTDARAVDAATVRVIEAASVAYAGVTVRGAVGPEVANRLEQAGISGDAASEAAGLLRECEAARFSPDATDMAAASDRWKRAQKVVRQLERA